MSATGSTEGKVEDVGNSIDDSLDSQRRTEELGKARERRVLATENSLSSCSGVSALPMTFGSGSGL
jgi:hypothetical protein